MKNIFLKITACAAMLIGLMAAVTGTRVLLGFFDPGYTAFSLLISSSESSFEFILKSKANPLI